MKKLSALLLVLLLTASCVETVVVGSLATIVVVTREKTLESTKDDVIIAAKIDKEFLESGLKSPRNSVSVMVNEGRVLLTGIVRDADKGRTAIVVPWKIFGVKEVIDEIEISDQNVKVVDYGGDFRDSFITSLIKSKLFFNQKIIPANYKILTFRKVVYVFGVAREDTDIKEVLRIISKTSGVKKVVNHVILANDSRRK